MTDIVPFPTDAALYADRRQRDVHSPVLAVFDINDTLGLVEKAGEHVRSLNVKSKELQEENNLLLEQIASDRAEWQFELQRIDRELEIWQKRHAESEALCLALKAEAESALQQRDDADRRVSLAIQRAEEAETRCRMVEGWLVRIQETFVSEFSDFDLQAAS